MPDNASAAIELPPALHAVVDEFAAHLRSEQDRSAHTVRAYAETGADFVSSGAITHQARSVDFNFRVELD